MNTICTAITASLSNLITMSASITGDALSLQALGFIFFGALIILFQFVPAMILAGGLVAGVIRQKEKKSDKGLFRDIKVP